MKYEKNPLGGSKKPSPPGIGEVKIKKLPTEKISYANISREYSNIAKLKTKQVKK